MVKKKVDSRIRTLIENGITLGHRSLFVLVGDHARDQIVNLHYILTKSAVRTKPSVLWAYKKDLGFTSHRQKRMRKLKKELNRGLKLSSALNRGGSAADDELSPFQLFLNSTDIRYCYYKETEKILGNTYGMLILQDFSALTPNLLARTMECVEGGGIIIILIKTLTSLKQLYTMTMDVHSRFRTESHHDVVGRFNERFLLSLSHCSASLVLDDELNILPISSHIKNIQKAMIPTAETSTAISSLAAIDSTATKTFKTLNDRHLYDLQQSLTDTQPVGSLVAACRTLDQGKALLTFVEAISEKTLRSTVVLTAARGRGKSAALGLAIAGAIAYGYSNIFVTAPSPENLKTLFTMILRGFDSLSYAEHTDYDIIQSTNPEWNKAVVRINVYHSHRQTIQYIQPSDSAKLSQAELLVIDEAAAIPLPIVKSLLGPYLVFMSSTIHGYEGTGRALSLKLVKQLRQQSVTAEMNANSSSSSSSASASSTGGRTLREITLEEPIRYSLNDPIESWLNDLLCLNCTSNIPRLTGGVPHPSQCELYYVERDTLFSAHRASEAFLQKMMALYVSSHYKNSPNDLQLMSDAPAHQLFVLLGPLSSTSSSTGEDGLPDILAVIQVCLEGAISKSSIMSGLGRGDRAAGDLIPWCIAQQYQNSEFAQLSGARIVRIATHPELLRMGYSYRAMELLIAFYEGKITSLREDTRNGESTKQAKTSASTEPEENGATSLLTEHLVPRTALPPLLQSLSDISPPALHYIGVSYGLTSHLFSFWSKSSFLPLYVRLTHNALTGEHTCIMLRLLQGSDINAVVGGQMQMRSNWLTEFVADFRHRFINLLSYQFAQLETALALSVLQEGNNNKKPSNDLQQQQVENDQLTTNATANGNSHRGWLSFAPSPLSFSSLSLLMNEYDLRRLESYADSLIDYHLILDLLPLIASLLFLGRLPITISYTQQAILLGLGSQHKQLEQLSNELGLPVQQLLAQFNKSVRKITNHIRSMEQQPQTQQTTTNKTTKKTPATHSQQANEMEMDNDEKEATDSVDVDDDESGFGEPLNRSLETDLYNAATLVKSQLREKHQQLLKPSSLQQYAIKGNEEHWENQLKNASGTLNRITIQTDQKFEGKRRIVHENSSNKKRINKEIGSTKNSGKKRKIKS